MKSANVKEIQSLLKNKVPVEVIDIINASLGPKAYSVMRNPDKKKLLAQHLSSLQKLVDSEKYIGLVKKLENVVMYEEFFYDLIYSLKNVKFQYIIGDFNLRTYMSKAKKRSKELVKIFVNLLLPGGYDPKMFFVLQSLESKPRVDLKYFVNPDFVPKKYIQEFMEIFTDYEGGNLKSFILNEELLQNLNDKEIKHIHLNVKNSSKGDVWYS